MKFYPEEWTSSLSSIETHNFLKKYKSSYVQAQF